MTHQYFNRGTLSCCVFGLLIFAFPPPSQSEPVCGDVPGAFGPFDYNDPQHHITPSNGEQSTISLVEDHHFTPDVERLVRGVSGHILGDITYTLNAFPNHHRALNAMARYYLKTKNVIDVRCTIDGWFNRAMRYRPRDGVVPMIYANYLVRKGKHSSGLKYYKSAIELMPKSAEAQYNLGLLYYKMKQYSLANKHAGLAYKLGYPLPGLRQLLKNAGKWNPE